jgi:hypothetical protein
VKILMEGYRAEATVQSEPTKLPPIAAEAISKADMVSKTEADDRSDGPPVIPPGIEPVYLPVHLSRSQAANSLGTDRIELNYEPVVAGFGRVRFYNTTRRIDHVKDIRFILPSDALEGFLRRNNGMEFGFELDDLRRDPEADAHFPRSLPNGMDNQKGKETEKAFGEYLYWETRP